MSETEQTRAEARPFELPRGPMLVALAVGGLGALMLVVGLVQDPRQALFSYLIAFAYGLGIALGAMAFVMATHAVNATWPVAIRRLPEAATATLPLFALLFLPIGLGAGLLYPWMHPHAVEPAESRHLLEHKLGYLNLPFVAVRAALCFGFWIVVAGRLRAWSLRMDRAAPPPELERRMRFLGSGALPFFGILGTVAAWDWLMSLSADWFSTMFGLYYLVGGFLSALALTAILSAWARGAGRLPGIGPGHFYGLGRLLFAFLVFWAYCGYWQYFLIWIANRPVEAAWFVARTTGAYGGVATFLVFGHFVVPFFLLLSYCVKRRAWALTPLAAWILIVHYLDVHWMVAAARGRPDPFSWLDAGALLFVGGLAVAFALWRQRGHLVAPVHDPRYARALEYARR